MNSDFFSSNRSRFCDGLKPNSFVVLTAFTRMQQTNDGAAPFVQESNFWYLTGVGEPDWLLIINVDSGEEWLVAPQLSFVHKAFDGDFLPEQAMAVSGVKTVMDRKHGREIFKKMLATKRCAYVVKPANVRAYGFVPNPAQSRLLGKLKDTETIDARPILAKMRAIKQPEEIAALQKAINVTLDGLAAVEKKLNNMCYEYEVDAELTSEFRRHGATHGFDPIIAAGKNACVLHYPLPKDSMAKDSWLLMDVGAKTDGYTADVTRTFAIGQPDARHQAVYNAVQRAQDFAIGQLREGVSAKEYLTKSYQNIGQELKKLGLIEQIKMDSTSVFKYMPHAISHGIGIDAHDPLGQPKHFCQNMALAVEVGIYIPEEGIGVRIENDVLITKDGVENMSK